MLSITEQPRNCLRCGSALVFDQVGAHCSDCARDMRRPPEAFLRSTLAAVILELERGETAAALEIARNAYDALGATEGS